MCFREDKPVYYVASMTRSCSFLVPFPLAAFAESLRSSLVDAGILLHGIRTNGLFNFGARLCSGCLRCAATNCMANELNTHFEQPRTYLSDTDWNSINGIRFDFCNAHEFCTAQQQKYKMLGTIVF